MADGTRIWSSRSPPYPAPGPSPFRGTFVGLQREMSELRVALEDAISGPGRLVMLAGDLGIGKTRTAQESGMRVGQLSESDGRSQVRDTVL